MQPEHFKFEGNKAYDSTRLQIKLMAINIHETHQLMTCQAHHKKVFRRAKLISSWVPFLFVNKGEYHVFNTKEI
jgi:hypothetical protein